MTAPIPGGLAARPDLLQTALEQSFNAVLITDADLGPGGCRIVYANPAFELMSGYARDELMGHALGDRVLKNVAQLLSGAEAPFGYPCITM